MSDDSNKQMSFALPDAESDGMELPVDPQGRGYAFFASEREKAIRRLKKRFGVMLGENVRLKLSGWDEEFEGTLKLNALLLPETRGDDIPLRIGRVVFDLRDMERCFRL